MFSCKGAYSATSQFIRWMNFIVTLQSGRSKRRKVAFVATQNIWKKISAAFNKSELRFVFYYEILPVWVFSCSLRVCLELHTTLHWLHENTLSAEWDTRMWTWRLAVNHTQNNLIRGDRHGRGKHRPLTLQSRSWKRTGITVEDTEHEKNVFLLKYFEFVTYRKTMYRLVCRGNLGTDLTDGFFASVMIEISQNEEA